MTEHWGTLAAKLAKFPTEREAREYLNWRFSARGHRHGKTWRKRRPRGRAAAVSRTKGSTTAAATAAAVLGPGGAEEEAQDENDETAGREVAAQLAKMVRAEFRRRKIRKYRSGQRRRRRQRRAAERRAARRSAGDGAVVAATLQKRADGQPLPRYLDYNNKTEVAKRTGTKWTLDDYRELADEDWSSKKRKDMISDMEWLLREVEKDHKKQWTARVRQKIRLDFLERRPCRDCGMRWEMGDGWTDICTRCAAAYREHERQELVAAVQARELQLRSDFDSAREARRAYHRQDLQERACELQQVRSELAQVRGELVLAQSERALVVAELRDHLRG